MKNQRHQHSRAVFPLIEPLIAHRYHRHSDGHPSSGLQRKVCRQFPHQIGVGLVSHEQENAGNYPRKVRDPAGPGNSALLPYDD
jgi:hypothetical protein